MTISPWLIYFADLADSLNTTIFIVFICFIGLSFILAIGAAKEDEEGEKEKSKILIKNALKFFYVSIFLLIAFILIPSTKTVYKMMIIPTAVNSQVIQKLPDELQQYVDKVLKDKDAL